MISNSASLISPVAADCPIASPSEKLCRPMPTAISNDNRAAGVANVMAVGRSAAAVAEPGPMRASRPGSLTGHPALVVGEAHQAYGDAGHGQRGEGPRTGPTNLPAPKRGDRFECGLDRVERLGEHVPEQEHQDPECQRVQERLDPGGGPTKPPDGEPEEDRQAGDGSQQRDARSRHTKILGSPNPCGQLP